MICLNVPEGFHGKKLGVMNQVARTLWFHPKLHCKTKFNLFVETASTYLSSELPERHLYPKDVSVRLWNSVQEPIFSNFSKCIGNGTHEKSRCGLWIDPTNTLTRNSKIT